MRTKDLRPEAYGKLKELRPSAVAKSKPESTSAGALEVGLIFDGFINLMGVSAGSKTTYLPSSVKTPSFYTELLVILSHLSANRDLVAKMCDVCEVCDLAACLVELVFDEGGGGDPQPKIKEKAEERDEAAEDLLMLGVTILVRLTSNRDFCVAMNEPFGDEAPEGIPAFKDGTYMDLLFLAMCKLIADRLTPACTPGEDLSAQRATELCFVILCNLSPFAETLCIDSTLKFFALFERCCRPSLLKRA